MIIYGKLRAPMINYLLLSRANDYLFINSGVVERGYRALSFGDLAIEWGIIRVAKPSSQRA